MQWRESMRALYEGRRARSLPEWDYSPRGKTDGYARSQEETAPDLPAEVPSGRASRPTSASARRRKTQAKTPPPNGCFGQLPLKA